MKRLISIILILLLFTSCAFAESDNSKKEILFRGFPWGCSIETVQHHFQELGFRCYTGVTNAYCQSESVEDSAFYCDISSNGNLSVAGHLVDHVDTYAVFGMVDSKISQSPSDSKLYRGTYLFTDSPNMEEVYNDLVSKLTSLYGLPKEPKYSIADYVWYGENNTSIEINYNGFLFPSVTIDYWDLTAYNDIIEIKQALFANSSSNTDGL